VISPVDSRVYLSREAFEIEQTQLFRKTWVFVGLKSFLRKQYDFIARTVGGLSVVIQNMDGKLVAYENSCPHKQMQLQWEMQGRRPIVCPFHGWSFDGDGKPKLIPHYDEQYKLTKEPFERACLKMFSVETIGELVFVNLSASPTPIDSQFGADLISRLIDMSAHFDDEVLQTKMTVRANWKLLLEVVRDQIHPQFLHARTLGPRRPMPVNKSRSNQFKAYSSSEVFDPASFVSPSLHELSGWGENVQEEKPQVWFDWVHRYGAQNCHQDTVLFPNTHMVCSTGGHSFSIEHYRPVSERETELELYIFLAKRKEERAADIAPIVPVILLSHAKEGQVFLDEDIAGVEGVQRGMEGGLPTLFGNYETENFRVRAKFAELYKAHGLGEVK
jgi:phenylpropionate dioxygenase-like ring-hydroxylating dioxygenase large terminal subunit